MVTWSGTRHTSTFHSMKVQTTSLRLVLALVSPSKFWERIHNRKTYHMIHYTISQTYSALIYSQKSRMFTIPRFPAG